MPIITLLEYLNFISFQFPANHKHHKVVDKINPIICTYSDSNIHTKYF